MSGVSSAATRSLSDAVAVEIQVQLLRRGWTQADLAARMGKSEMWVSRRLRQRGQRQVIDLDDLARIADALGTTPGRLVDAATATIDAKTVIAKRVRERTARTITAKDRRPIGKSLQPIGPSARIDRGRPADRVRRLYRLPRSGR